MNAHTCPQVLLLHALGESHRARRRVRKHFRDFGVKHVCVSISIYEAKMIIIIICIDTQTPSGVESEKNPRK